MVIAEDRQKEVLLLYTSQRTFGMCLEYRGNGMRL